MEEALATSRSFASATYASVASVYVIAFPIALTNLVAVAHGILDFGIVGRCLPPEALVALCLSHVVIHLVLEPCVFILHNAVTSLCANAVAAQHSADLVWHLRAACLFSVLIAIPIIALVLVTPRILASPCVAVPVEVTQGIDAYAPAYALAVAPSLLLAALLGFLRAHGQQRSTAAISWLSLVPNAVLALLMVPRVGLRGSAYATAGTRLVCLLLLARRHRVLVRPALGTAPGGKDGRSAAATLRAPMLYLVKDFCHSVLPVALRVVVAPLLALIAIASAIAHGAGASAASASRQAACLAMIGLLLQGGVSVCMGVQQATIMLVTRHVSLGRHEQARSAMRLAAALLVALTSACAAPCYALRAELGAIFLGGGSSSSVAGGVGDGGHATNATAAATTAAAAAGNFESAAFARSELTMGMGVLAVYVAPLLILKTASGLYGLFFAVTERGAIATWVLLISHGCIGLPAAWQWASVTGGGAEALLQAHAASWLLAALAFAVCYTLLPTSPPESTSAMIGIPAAHRGAASMEAAAKSSLAQPLLEDGRASQQGAEVRAGGVR
jgi:Na+-driven multidrug efflux pump